MNQSNNKNLSQPKTRHNKIPLKRLVSITVDRFAKASANEQKSVLNFFDWLERSTTNTELQGFHSGIKSQLKAVQNNG